MAKKKQAGSRASQSKRSKGHIGLGIKKYGGDVVCPGNIIVRQRGTKYHAGRNTSIGRDHTIFAVAEGIVSYASRNNRKYIDVVPAGSHS